MPGQTKTIRYRQYRRGGRTHRPARGSRKRAQRSKSRVETVDWCLPAAGKSGETQEPTRARVMRLRANPLPTTAKANRFPDAERSVQPVTLCEIFRKPH